MALSLRNCVHKSLSETRQHAATFAVLKIFVFIKKTNSRVSAGRVNVQVISFLIFPNFSMAGDFHFVWEFFRVVIHCLWGSDCDTGSLSNLRNIVNRKHVEKKVKVFNIGEEFLSHAFNAHLLAAIADHFKVSSWRRDLPESKTLAE